MDATERELRIELERREWAAALGPDDPRLAPANPALAGLTTRELEERTGDTFRRPPSRSAPNR